ncbi:MULTISPECIES: hypothetical protein [unclassified Streptomyces]|uniref:hypothetical protein n=1 Tax=unclassified Streptomyces TaxID=2593676 RepID=UPI000B8317D6|nr:MULTISPECIES: hypothetical protein [unclassified Streptomyces]MYS20898.1 hypothetical protein [Streptomyces sp. SID4948]
MATSTLYPVPTSHGGTSIGAHPEPPGHRLGNVLRAVRVFASAAVEVVILGSDGQALGTSRYPN